MASLRRRTRRSDTVRSRAAKLQRYTLAKTALSVIELQHELDQPRIIAGRGDAAKTAWIDDLPGVRIKADRQDGVEVAIGISQVDVVEQIEELSAEFDRLCF